MLTIHVDFPGDPSVGIFGATWDIHDIPEPHDDAEREEIREAFSAAFELVTGGGHRVYFSDEIPQEPKGHGE